MVRRSLVLVLGAALCGGACGGATHGSSATGGSSDAAGFTAGGSGAGTGAGFGGAASGDASGATAGIDSAAGGSTVSEAGQRTISAQAGAGPTVEGGSPSGGASGVNGSAGASSDNGGAACELGEGGATSVSACETCVDGGSDQCETVACGDVEGDGCPPELYRSQQQCYGVPIYTRCLYQTACGPFACQCERGPDLARIWACSHE